MNPLERDRDMVRSPDKWVAFPLLPLKHRWRKFNDDNSFGFILAGNPCKVYVARMYFAITRLSGKKTWAEAVEGMPTQHYPSVEALTDDWTVAAMPISEAVLLIIACSRLHQSATLGTTSEQTRRMHRAWWKPKGVSAMRDMDSRLRRIKWEAIFLADYLKNQRRLDPDMARSVCNHAAYALTEELNNERQVRTLDRLRGTFG